MQATSTVPQLFTSLDEIPKIHQRARQAFRSGKTKSIAFRKEQIVRVGYLVKDNEGRFKEALKHDLGRPPLETEFLEFAQVYLDVAKAYSSVDKWASSKRAEFDLSWWFMGPKHTAEPKGSVLIISPFNCPVMLALSPMVRLISKRGTLWPPPTKPAESGQT